MKKSKRYIKKLNKTPLINKRVTPELEEKALNEIKKQ